MRAPSITDVQAIAEAEIAAIPQTLRRQVGNIVVQVVDLPDEEVCQAMELESPFDLLGLYMGEALTERNVSAPTPEPDMVQLYRRSLLNYWCESEAALANVVRYVLLHEIGHHFGYSDEEMDALQGEP